MDQLILDSHLRMHRISVGSTIVTLSDHFWVPSGRAINSRLLCPCVTKVRQDTSACPFSNIGVNFTGHLTVKDLSGSHIIVYICLFTCFTARAFNLEIIEDLTTSSLLQAFRHHCSIFSTPQVILSDNSQRFK